MFNLHDPFFEPVWRRILIVGVTLGWAVFEAVAGAPAWGFAFAALGLFCAYQFFIAWPLKEDDD